MSNFNFDFGIGSNRPKSLNDQRNPNPSPYSSSTTQSKPTWQPNKPSWTHQPAPAQSMVRPGGLNGPASMVGDITGKSWNSGIGSGSGIGIVEKNPNLFCDLVTSAIGNTKGSSNSNVPLKNVNKSSYSMGNLADSLPKTSGSTAKSGGGWVGKNSSMQVVKLVSHVSFLLLMLMFQPALARAPAGLAKPNCPDHCGNISIPYPFGIGKDCYMAESYDVECDETSTPPRASLRSIKMDLVNITLEGGAVVKGPVISVDSLRRQEVLPLNLEGTPFFTPHITNYFIAVGCNTRASLWTKNGTTEHVGCDSICSNGTSISNIQLTGNSICKDCCQGMSWPPSLQVFNSTFELIDAKQGSDGRKLAFLADQYWFDDKIWSPQEINKLSSTVPMSLAWILNTNSWKYNEDTMDNYCEVWELNSTTKITSGRCSCSEGYEGNPYLQCRDIDECKDRNNTCHGLTRCVNTKGSYKCKLHPLLLTLLVIGLALGVLFLLIGAWWMSKLIKRRRCIQLKKKFFKRNGGLLLQQQLSSSDGSVRKTKVFSSNELEKATDFFNENRILGHGGQGTVYKGMLADGTIVAVKKSTIVDEDKLEEFINEVVILSQINHRNVVRLLGCCLETDVPLLVYEFIPNGTLFQYLHEQNEDFTLSWELRLRIASEAAGAISYLHSTASIPIYHRDIKSTNILLDEKYRAKVSDFGTSRSVSIDQTHLTTKVQGTFGYLDPEYFQTSQLTEKSDVYSFGVVLVELLSGKKTIFLSHSLETMSLAKHFIDFMEDGRLFDIIDAQVKGDCIEEEAIVIANLAKRCLHLNGKNRPTMREVAMELEGILLSRNGINIQQIIEVDNSSRSISSSSFEIGIDLPLDCKPSISSETW